MIRAALLKQGDRIAIVAPARRISPTEIDTAIRTFQSWGLEVVLAKHLHSNAHSYLAGSDTERLNDLQSYIDDASIKAIISARGGYGSSRIIDQLDLSGFINAPKWMIGFSDITAVHLKLYKAGVISIHGTMPILFPRPESKPSVESLRQILFSKEFSISIEPHERNRPGESEGVLVGGNLSLLTDSLGTPSEVDTRNAILVIEEIDEYLYRIDRMITQLKRAGKLASLKGLIVGHMTNIKDDQLPFGETVDQIILNAVAQYNFPIAFKFPSGHENPNFAWRHGEKVIMKVTRENASISSLTQTV